MRVKKGFTLAEILIVLMVIGVIATMTVPSLMKGVNEAQFKTAYKKAFNAVTNIAAVEKISGQLPTSNSLTSAKNFFASLNANLSVKELKDILDKYYGPNAIAIPGFDKAVTNWNGTYTVPDISNNTYNILYFNTTYYGDITQGYIYKKYHQEPLWEELALDTDYQKVTHIIGNIFLQGEKLYGDGELHIGDFLFNGSDQYAPIGEIIIEGGEFSGSPLPMGSYTCTSGFGYRGNIGLAGASKNHKAIDLAVPVGTPVYTVGAGTVSYSGSLGSCGNAIKIEHGNGLQTRYCHLSTLNVKVGQTVQSGDVIALSGNTGNSTGPHLDFQVNQNGTAVDPRSVIDALKGLKCTNGL